ncbi:ankyrin [Aspergillus campestris IBT 28561]|uniref:Ankyrin n=1 Tax=Aspergillus campestris (strain IBT 28561) TaxID=1392248 RepID=A0A2I1CUC2_ASPC2|nr:ankyrin [Aspergillus campestris IBT 28561]PKY01209.1 ankyrin [Aspergillus campestris IBT 28561]
MSFGFSVGDILATLRLADDLKKRFSQAPKEFRTISDEVKRVWAVLHDLDDIPIDGLNQQQGRDVQDISQGCREVLEELKVKLDRSQVLAYTNSDWRSKARQAWCRVTWDQIEIDRLRDRITTTVTVFNLLMGKINRTLTLEIQNNLDVFYEEQRDTSSRYALSRISSIDGWTRHAENLSAQQPGSGAWFINKQEFRAWCHNEKQLLYCPGMPGAGKTVLCSVAIECLEQSFASQDDIAITYIFFDFRQQLSLFEILAALLRQLLQGKPNRSVTRHLRETTKELMKLEWVQCELRTLVLGLGKTYIVLDALDECAATGSTLRQLIEFLLTLRRTANINILATSRYNEEIANLFTQDGVILEIQANDDDIRAFIDHRAAYFPQFVAKKPGLLAYIRDEIVKASQGMFLLAKIYTSLVQDEINEKQIRKVIERLQSNPGVYDNAYDESMMRIERQGQFAQDIAKTIFGWILYSKRPLSLPEIQHALAVEIGESEFDDTNIIDIEQLVSVGIGLVMVDRESNSLKFVHYTTKEYLERKLHQWFPDIHRIIGLTCLTYVSLNVFDHGPCDNEEALDGRLTCYPFYKYSAQNWGHHFLGQDGAESMAMEFLASEGKVHGSSQVIFGFSDDTGSKGQVSFVSDWKRRPIVIKEPLTAAHLAAFFGLTRLLAGMLTSNMIEVDIHDHVGRTPLSWATAYGHEELVNMLLEQGANRNSMNRFGFTPLFYAAVGGRVGILKSLIMAGADVNIADKNGRTPLFHAAAGDSSHMMSLAFEGDCLASVRLLLEYGASATQIDNFGQTPLFAAASNGRDSVAKLLIEHNAHLDYATAPDSVQFDPLAYAAMNGHASTAKLLSETGAYIVATQSGKDAASYVTLANLLKAGSDGHGDVFKDLQDSGADPNIRDSHDRLPLHWAAFRGNDNLLKCLLANGADINAQDVFGRTPLFYAVFGARHSTALLLLDDPSIDFQHTDVFGDTPQIHSRKRQSKEEHQWKIYNLLKIKNGDYEGLLHNTSYAPPPQAHLYAACDACLYIDMCIFACTKCTAPVPLRNDPRKDRSLDPQYAESLANRLLEGMGSRWAMVRYCSICVSEDKPCRCPLCGQTLHNLLI